MLQEPEGRGHGQHGQRGTGVPRSGAGEALWKGVGVTWGQALPGAVSLTPPFRALGQGTLPFQVSVCFFMYKMGIIIFTLGHERMK